MMKLEAAVVVRLCIAMVVRGKKRGQEKKKDGLEMEPSVLDYLSKNH